MCSNARFTVPHGSHLVPFMKLLVLCGGPLEHTNSLAPERSNHSSSHLTSCLRCAPAPPPQYHCLNLSQLPTAYVHYLYYPTGRSWDAARVPYSPDQHLGLNWQYQCLSTACHCFPEWLRFGQRMARWIHLHLE